MAGENPMRWECSADGCFNKKKRPKIEQFAECFPGKIKMGDVDGLVEINGHFLLLEWKSFVGDIPRGQDILYQRLTRFCNDWVLVVLVVAGDAELMQVRATKVIANGTEQDWLPSDMESLCAKIRNWVAFVQKRRRPRACNCADVTKRQPEVPA